MLILLSDLWSPLFSKWKSLTGYQWTWFAMFSTSPSFLLHAIQCLVCHFQWVFQHIYFYHITTCTVMHADVPVTPFHIKFLCILPLEVVPSPLKWEHFGQKLKFSKKHVTKKYSVQRQCVFLKAVLVIMFFNNPHLPPQNHAVSCRHGKMYMKDVHYWLIFCIIVVFQ